MHALDFILPNLTAYNDEEFILINVLDDSLYIIPFHSTYQESPLSHFATQICP